LTLIGIEGSFLPEIIFSYISKCCELVDEIIEGLAKGDGSQVIQIPLFNWDEVPGEYDIEVVRIIADEFGIEFLGDSKIEPFRYHSSQLQKAFSNINS
jgi:hypothetical protein